MYLATISLALFTHSLSIKSLSWANCKALAFIPAELPEELTGTGAVGCGIVAGANGFVACTFASSATGVPLSAKLTLCRLAVSDCSDTAGNSKPGLLSDGFIPIYYTAILIYLLVSLTNIAKVDI